jgi:hypothetical protein
MALPDLIKHIYHNATDEVIRRGKRIFHTSGVQMLENDTLIEQVTFRVRNDVYNNYYKVIVQNYSDGNKLQVRCQCPYNMGTVCRHEAAALFQLNDLLQSGYFENVNLSYDQEHTTIRMRQITAHFIKLFSSKEIFEKAEDWVERKQLKILEAKNDAVKATVTDDDKQTFDLYLKQNEERYFDTSCTCKEQRYPLCVHKATVFLDILNRHGGHYFSTLRNWDVQKDKLLSLYGYSIKDDIKGKFEFSYHEGKPFLRLLDPSIKKIDLQQPTYSSSVKPAAATNAHAATITVEMSHKRMGVLIEAKKSPYYPYTNFGLLTGNPQDDNSGFTGKIEQMEAGQYISPAGLQDRDKLLITALRKQSPDELFKYIKKDSPFGDFWDSLPQELTNTPTETLQKQAWEFYVPRYQRLLEQFQNFPYIYFLPEGKKFSAANVEKAQFSSLFFKLNIHVLPAQEGGAALKLQYVIGEEAYEATSIEVVNAALIRINNTFYAAANIDVVKVMQRFQNEPSVSITENDWPAYLNQSLLPLSGNTTILFDDYFKVNKTEVEPELKLYLRETDKMMVFKPIFDYEGVEKQWLDYTPAVTAQQGKVVVHERNEATEHTFLNLLRYMHPLMQESRKLHGFLLPDN